MASRRQRIDSATSAVATIAAAARDLAVPDHVTLRDGDRPFWDAIIAEKPRSEWSDSDLIVAANLARAMADAELVASTTVKRGKVTPGAIVASIAASDKLARRIVTLRRALGLDNRSKHGEQRDVNRRRDHAHALENGQNPMREDDDELLARPGTLQ